MSEQQGAEKRPREPEADGATAAPAAPAEEEREEKKSRASPSPSAPDPSVKTQLKVAVSSDQGTKQYMEDISVVMHDARKEGAASSRLFFAGIFDGHGGKDVATLVSAQLHERCMGCGLQQVAAASTSSKVDGKAAKAAISEGYKATDELVLKECTAKGWQDGACAVAIWVVGETALVANVGDAKAVLARIADKDGPGFKAGTLRGLVITKDHLAIYPGERARIEKAGGYVSDGRLNGRMQVSRSFGDAALKKAGCSAAPDIAAFEITERDRFLLAACDGFWTVFDPQEAIKMAAAHIDEGKDEKWVTNRLLNEAVRERKCKDNCTVLLLRFVRQ